MHYYAFLWLVTLYQLPLQSMSTQKQSNVQEEEVKNTDALNLSNLSLILTQTKALNDYNLRILNLIKALNNSKLELNDSNLSSLSSSLSQVIELSELMSIQLTAHPDHSKLRILNFIEALNNSKLELNDSNLSSLTQIKELNNSNLAFNNLILTQIEELLSDGSILIKTKNNDSNLSSLTQIQKLNNHILRQIKLLRKAIVIDIKSEQALDEMILIEQPLKSIIFHSTITGQCLCTFYNGPSSWLNPAVYNKDETPLLPCSWDEAIKLWDVSSGKCLHTLKHNSKIKSAVYNKDGTQILSCSGDGTIKIWDASSGQCLITITAHKHGIKSAIYNKDETRILSCSWEGTIKIWDIKTGTCLRTFTGQIADWMNSEIYNSAVYNKDETHILSSCNSTIKIWDVKTGRCLRTLRGHNKDDDGYVKSAVYNKNETHILSYCSRFSKDKTIKIWDAATGLCLRTLVGHTDYVKSAVYNKDGTQILSCSGDGTIKLWDASSGECLRTFTGHKDRVRSAIYNKDETQILSRSYDRTIKIWDNGYLRVLNLASLSHLSNFLAYVHSLTNQVNALYLPNDLLDKLKEAVLFICLDKSDSYEVLTLIYLHIVQHIPSALQKEVLESVTIKALRNHLDTIIDHIKPLFTTICSTTLNETKRSIEHYLHQKHFSPCMIDFVLDRFALEYNQNRLSSEPTTKESFDRLCLQQAAANTLASLKLLPHHNDHQHFNDAHAVAQIGELLKTNTHLTQLSGLNNDTQPSLTQALEKNSTVAAKPNSSPAIENEAYVQKEDLYAGLAIDSGLMHTLIPAVVLRAIEKKYKVETHKLFDCIGGSGFGALIALGLTATRDNRTRFMDPQTLVDFFYKNAHIIFKSKNSKSNCYNPDNFKKVVRSYFNEIPLSDVLTHVIIPCSTINPTVPFIFDSLEAQKSLAYDFRIQDVVQAACADDCYFPTITFEDISHARKNTYRSYRPPYNPADDVYKVLLKKAKNDKEHIRLLSLGASFFKVADFESEVKLSAINDHLTEELSHSYRRLIPKVATAQELHFGDRDDTRYELFDLYSQEAEKLVEDNNFIRLLVETKK